MNLMELYEGGKKSGMTRYIKLIVMVNLQMILKKKIVFLTMEKNTQIGNASTLQIIRLWFFKILFLWHDDRQYFG